MAAPPLQHHLSKPQTQLNDIQTNLMTISGLPTQQQQHHLALFKLLSSDKSLDARYSTNILSWNIEGAKRGAANLAHFVKIYLPALMFLSEPQLFQCDTSLALAPLLPTYCHHLNSEDKFYPDLALEKHHAHGGTLALWHSALDPFITILPTTSPAVLPLVLSVPGISSSIHIGIYLPTSGKDEHFVLALAALTAVLESVLEEHHDVPIYVRGDANVNPSNLPRSQLFSNFLTRFNLRIFTSITSPNQTSLNCMNHAHRHKLQESGFVRHILIKITIYYVANIDI